MIRQPPPPPSIPPELLELLELLEPAPEDPLMHSPLAPHTCGGRFVVQSTQVLLP